MRGPALVAVSLLGLAACTAPPRAAAPALVAAPTTMSHEQAVGALADARQLIERHDHGAARTRVASVLGDANRWEWFDVVADGQFLLGELADRDRKPREAADAYARAYDGAQKLGDLERGVRALNALTNAFLDAGAWAKAREAAGAASRLAARRGDIRAEATAQNNLAEVDRIAGRLAEARRGYEHALELAHQAGDRAAEAAILLNLGVTERRAGRLGPARARFAAAQRLARALDDKRADAYAQWHLDQLEAEIRRSGGSLTEGDDR
jgi:tetratricopeptide (TPR) repeat protein